MGTRQVYTAQLRASVTPELKRRLRIEALRQRRSDSSLLRTLLEDILPEILTEGDEYEVELSRQEATSLIRQGYNLEPIYLTGEQLALPGW